MNGYLKAEIKKAIFSLKTVLTVILILGCVLVELCAGGEFGINIFTNNGVFIMMKILSIGMVGSLAFMIPLIAVIPYSTTYKEEKEDGFINFLLTRISKKKYITVKILVNICVTGGIFLVTLLGVYISILLIKGFPEIELMQKFGGLFSGIYIKNPGLYPILVIVGMTFFVICFSIFSLGLSTIVNNKYVAMVLPAIIYYICPLLSSALGIDSFINFDLIHLIDIGYVTNIKDLIIIYTLLGGSGLFLIYKNILKEKI